MALIRRRLQVDGGAVEQSNRNRVLTYYELASAIVWAALLIGVALILQGTDYFAQLLGILGGAAAFFVVVLPVSLSRVK